MSISEKLTTIAENEQLVFEAGKKALFERIQDGGKTQNYYYAFAYDRFDDTNFCPVYPIKCSNGTTPGRYIFYNSSGITDTKVEIVANSTNVDYCFHGCSNLVTIPKLTVTETTVFNSTFNGCTALVEIRIGGTIGKNISFSYSPLTVKSMKSVIEHLKDYSGTDTTPTLTFRADRENMLTDEEKAVAINKGWTLVWS